MVRVPNFKLKLFKSTIYADRNTPEENLCDYEFTSRAMEGLQHLAKQPYPSCDLEEIQSTMSRILIKKNGISMRCSCIMFKYYSNTFLFAAGVYNNNIFTRECVPA